MGSHRPYIRQRRRRPIRQCQTYWCWAAILQELHRLRLPENSPDAPPTQCQIVASAFPDRTCACLQWEDPCDPTRRCNCNDTRDIGLHLSVELKRYDHDLRLHDVARHLASGRPVVGCFIASEQRHYVLITAITEDSPWVLEVADPSVPGTLVRGIRESNRSFSFNDRVLYGAYLIQEVIP